MLSLQNPPEIYTQRYRCYLRETIIGIYAILQSICLHCRIMFNSADIDLIPDYDKYCARSAFLSTNGLAKGTIPSGWPRELYGPLVWEGRGMMDEKQYVFELEEGQKAEISRALDYCKG